MMGDIIVPASDDDEQYQEFSWSRDTLIHEQRPVAIYRGAKGDVVIRQESWPEDDVWVTIDPLHLPIVISKLLRIQRGEE